jgi:peptidoglycan/LPS O-acetylase OafA/YrhL
MAPGTNCALADIGVPTWDRSCVVVPQDLKQLTTLRFFAAMWVVLFHYWPSLGIAMPALLAKGYLGVELFFTLSGFILCHVYLARFGAERFHYAEFLWARLARVYPVHLVTLLGMGALALGAAALGLSAGNKLLIWPSLIPNLLLMQAWGFAPGGGWNHPSWSISAEWFAYLMFPLFAAGAWRMRTRPGLALVCAIGLLITVYEGFFCVAGFPLTQATIAWGALRVTPCFALGCTIYLVWRRGVLATAPGAIGATLASLLAAVGLAAVGAPDWATVTAFAGLILGLAAMAGARVRAFSGRVWVYLGEVSFCVYMVCIPWMQVFENGGRKLLHLQGDALPLALWMAMLAGVVPAAMALHHLVERPARTLMRRHGVPFTRRTAGGGHAGGASPHRGEPIFHR